MTKTLQEWKAFLFDAIEEVRCTPMSDADRDVLVEFIKEESESIFFGPSPASEMVISDMTPPPAPEHGADDAWSDLGYERRERDQED